MPIKFLHDLDTNGEVKGASLDINGNADISGNITSASWTGDVIGSAYLDADTTHNSVAQTSTAMKSFEVPLTNNEDWANSPISILERGNVNAAQSADKYAPNLNFHWGAVVSNSLWMGHNGHLNYGDYNSSGVPAADGIFNVATVNANLTGNVTGNTSGSSGSCTGLAATATALATARNIGGVSFNGTSAINLPGVNTAGNQNTSGNATTATTATNANNVKTTSVSNSTDYFGVFVDANGTAYQDLHVGAGLKYNPSTDTISAGKISTDVASIVENNKSNAALMTLTGQGAGNEANISLKLVGTSNGNPLKMKMIALDDGGSQVGAGFLSYDAEDDSFGIGQSSSHNRMGVKIENTISLSNPNVHYEPTSIKAREYVASANGTHYDFYGDIIRNGNDTTVRGKLYIFKTGTWTIANADTLLDANGMAGIALGTNSTTHGMLLKGTYTLDYDPGGAGNVLYVGLTDGVMTATIPGNSGDVVRVMGYLIGGTHGNMFFDPAKTFVEVA